MASPNEIIAAGVEDLEKAFNEVVVQATKAIRDSSRESRGPQGAAGPSLASRLEYPTQDFQMALDEIEREVTRAMSVNLRDLRELRERRMPPPAAAPVTATAPTPVAPQAPMSVDLDSPVTTETPAPGPTATTPGSTAVDAPSRLPGPAHASKQDNKPPAPVPDMGFDLSVSPEVRPSPSPALSQAKAKQVNSSPKTSPIPAAATTATLTGTPGSAPPKNKERSAAPEHQTSRTAGSAPRPPAHAASAPVAPPAPMMDIPTSLGSSVPHSAATAPHAQTQGQAPPQEMVFTDMTFSVDTAVSEPTHGVEQVKTQPEAQQHAPADDSNVLGMTQFGAAGDMSGDFGMSSFDSGMLDLASGGAMNNGLHNDDNMLSGDSNNAMVGTSDLDADIEKLFASQEANSAEDKMDMDYGLGEIGLANNSFDDINWGDDISGDGDLDQDFNAPGS